MPFSLTGPIGKFLKRRQIAWWRQAAKEVPQLALGELTARNEHARRLLRHVGQFKAAADSRLALPRIGSSTFPQPSGTDWAWRPKPWASSAAKSGLAPALSKTAFTDELMIFHDCRNPEITLRQSRNMREIDLSVSKIELEVFHFDGTYLSLVVEVPQASCEGLQKNHLIQLAAVIERDRPTKIYARLNVKNGPNTEQILMTLPDDTPETLVEFDLAYSGLNEIRAERMWVDIMIESPAMNKVTIRDLTMCRYPRAEI